MLVKILIFTTRVKKIITKFDIFAKKTKMKNTLLLIALFLASASSFSQALHVNGTGNVYDNENNKWTVKEVEDILYTHPKALELYKEGREKKTWGNVLLYGGLAAVATNVIINATTEPEIYSGSPYYSTPTTKSTFAPAIIGAAMIIVAIPVKIGHSKKVKTAINMYNNSLNQTAEKVETKVTFMASSNQVGFKLQF